jgi:ABC-type Fe3+/spermidine/putrescine transport system ATPase subunit
MSEAVGLQLKDLVASYEGTEVVHGLSFSIKPAEFVTLLGPSGCGKSTTLRCVAGLHRIDSGVIAIGETTVADGHIHVRPEHRRVNMVFQSYAVWPHMTVFDNVAYGVRMAKLGKADIVQRVNEMLELVGLVEFANRSATGLSGGQQQRVALARALATRPRILLLDEPLSNLDSVLRARMRTEILRIQRETNTTTLYVTHDCSEALSMSDRIVVLDRGRIDQVGQPKELYDLPANRFVARFLGPVNFATAKVIRVLGDEVSVVCPDLASAPSFVIKNGHLRTPAEGATIDLVMRPERLKLQPPGEAGLNSFTAKVIRRDFLGSKSELTLSSGAMTLACEVTRDALSRADNDRATIFIDPDDLTWVPHEERGADPTT